MARVSWLEWKTTLFLTFSLQKGPSMEKRTLNSLRAPGDEGDNVPLLPRSVDDVTLSDPEWKRNVEKLG